MSKNASLVVYKMAIPKGLNYQRVKVENVSSYIAGIVILSALESYIAFTAHVSEAHKAEGKRKW